MEKIVNKSIALYRTFFLFLLCSFIATNPALAAGVGGLDKGTNFIGELRIWAYGFVGAIAILHILWKVFQAYTEMDSWSGVLKSLMYAAIAGGCVVAAEACYQIFK
ncbi:hypothetical protein LFR21_004942 [Escherichia coli]|nr:hypothetical protein [Escherichia coli]EFP7514513.1 hypothetical protein [Shigella flexneri]KEJ69023.1 putative membrane protein [Escherichia coli 5-366-08_S1_C3]HEE9795398.1 hypothetical protein [Shigella sonnei]EFV8483204.1 hypothetical protein [Shigella flexneri]